MAPLFSKDNETALNPHFQPEISGASADRLLECLPLRKGIRFVDAACGAGTYFFPVFERLRGEGVFIAAEYREELLRQFFTRLEDRTTAPGFTRIEVARSRPDRLPLPHSSADLGLLAGAYFALPDPRAYLAELWRVLSPGGVLCLLDADQGGHGFEKKALEDMERTGFKWPVIHSGFGRQVCLTARK